jgi:hypothetical protein
MLVLASDPACARIRYDGGDGASPAQAVVITGAVAEFDGVQAEYAWLEAHYPGYTMTSQGLLNIDQKSYDVLKFRHQGKDLEVYFDISAFFGKF